MLAGCNTELVAIMLQHGAVSSALGLQRGRSLRRYVGSVCLGPTVGVGTAADQHCDGRDRAVAAWHAGALQRVRVCCVRGFACACVHAYACMGWRSCAPGLVVSESALSGWITWTMWPGRISDCVAGVDYVARCSAPVRHHLLLRDPLPDRLVLQRYVQQRAAWCNSAQRGATRCSVVQHGAAGCKSTVKHVAARCSALQRSAACCCGILHCNMMRSAALRRPARCCHVCCVATCCTVAISCHRSIRHLREASQTDGKAARNMQVGNPLPVNVKNGQKYTLRYAFDCRSRK
jgi:hypothetical protein